MSKKSAAERNAYLRQYRLSKKAEKSGIKIKPRKASTAKPQSASLSHEEIQARDEAMRNRYSNPPTYKALK
jgi:hypothetical protein